MLFDVEAYSKSGAFPNANNSFAITICQTSYGPKRPTFPRRVVFDAMKVMSVHLERTDKKPDNYSLDNIANVTLGHGKMDLSIPEMRRAYEEGEYGIIAKYCMIDTELPLQILHKEGMVTLLFQLASISGASLQQAFAMTNSSLCIATLAYEVHENGYVYDLPRPNKKSKFEGAYVHEPKPGLYEAAAVLDFASLYPSIAISYNLCYSTLLPQSEEGKTFSV